MILKNKSSITPETYIHNNYHLVKKKLLLISLNTNGIRAALNKGLVNFLQGMKPDVLCVQETKIGNQKIQDFLKQDIAAPLLSHYHYCFSSSQLRQGYAGTALFIHKSCHVLRFITDFDLNPDSLLKNEGRLTGVEFIQFILVTCYVPNSGRGQTDNNPQNKTPFMNQRVLAEQELLSVLQKLQQLKPVIYAGDLNVAHMPIDLFDFKRNIGNPGCTEQERVCLNSLLNDCNLIDSFRYQHPDVKKYSWFSNFGNARSSKHGWRIDYFLVDERLKQLILNTDILDNFCDYSDHVPVLLEIGVNE